MSRGQIDRLCDRSRPHPSPSIPTYSSCDIALHLQFARWRYSAARTPARKPLAIAPSVIAVGCRKLTIEQLASPFLLQVIRIFDLHPRRLSADRVVRTD